MSVTCQIVTNEILIYESDWVGCNPIPVQYKIESDKFPLNQFDSLDIIDLIQDNDGFAQVQVSSSYEDYEVPEWIRIQDCDVEFYNGIWQIKSIYNDLITLDLPFVSNASEGTFQRYYYNYFVEVRVYCGFPAGHYFESENPTKLVTTLHIQPSPDNIAYIDISEAIRSEFPIIKNETCEQLEFAYDYAINDRNAWTSFYIEFQEIYDVASEGEIITFESGYTNGNAILNTNPEFENDLLGYTQFGSDSNWTWSSQYGGSAFAFGSVFTTNELRQSINVVAGQTYKIKLVFSLQGFGSAGEITLEVGGVPVAFKSFSGNEYNFEVLEYTYTALSTTLQTFGFLAASTNLTIYLYVQSFEVVNPAEAPVFYAINGTQQIGYSQGNNFGEYVVNDNNLLFPTKFLTLFEKPNHFEGYEFNLSIIFPQEIMGGDELYFRVIEYDLQANEIADTRYEIPQYDAGVYRLLLSTIIIELDTNKYEVFIEKNDGITYERISEIKEVNYITDCCRFSPTLINWFNYLGAWESHLFCAAKQFQTNVEQGNQIKRNILNQWDNLFIAGVEQFDKISLKSRNSGILRSNFVSKEDFNVFRQWLVSSIKVQKLIDLDESVTCINTSNRRTILIQNNTIGYEELDKLFALEIEYIDSIENLIQRQ